MYPILEGTNVYFPPLYAPHSAGRCHFFTTICSCHHAICMGEWLWCSEVVGGHPVWLCKNATSLLGHTAILLCKTNSDFTCDVGSVVVNFFKPNFQDMILGSLYVDLGFYIELLIRHRLGHKSRQVHRPLSLNDLFQEPLIMDGRNCCKWTYH